MAHGQVLNPKLFPRSLASSSSTMSSGWLTAASNSRICCSKSRARAEGEQEEEEEEEEEEEGMEEGKCGAVLSR